MPPSYPAPTPRVIVVGAGVAGLSCAHQLLRSPQNFDVVLLEARSRPGGRVLTHWLSPNDPSAPPVHPPSALPHPSAIQAQQWPTLNHDAVLAPPIQQNSTSAIAAPYNSNSNAPNSTPRRHAFSDLVSGVTTPVRASPDGTQRLSVDIGASIMHGCGDEHQLVFKRAITERIRAPVVPGGGFYESTEHALWFDDNTGNIIPTAKIVEIHNLFFMASRYMAAVASQSDDGAANMQNIFNCGVSYVTQHLGDRVLSAMDQAILKKICARSVGYCSPMAVMALMQASAGMEATSADAHIGVPFEEDDPPFPGEIPSMSPNGIKTQAARLHKSVVASQKTGKNIVATRKGGPGDRIVLDGYTPFLIDRLREGVDIRFNQSVCAITRAIKPIDPALQYQQQLKSRTRKRGRTDMEVPMQPWNADPDVANRTVLVATRSGEVYQGDFVVITVPLGVLQRDHEESSVSFSPPLSEEKQDAIRGMGMGVHNKIVLRFREQDVFWPPKVPQLNCLDPRFQFFNLHSYGKTGVLLVHVFAESGFANGYCGLTDEGVVAEVLTVLGGMFCAPAENVPGEGATSINVTPSTKTGIPIALSKNVAKRKIASLLNICENCRRPLGATSPASKDCLAMEKPRDEPQSCKECGFVVQKDDEILSPRRPEQRSARLREKAENAPPDHMDLSGEGEEDIILPKRRLTWQQFPAPEEYVVTRWEEDPFSLGSYSYMPCGSSWTMIDQMAAPEPRESPHPYLFFAGEHCSDMGWQCVHGAHETGIRAAREIMACVNGGQVPEMLEEPIKEIVRPPTPPHLKMSPQAHPFWSREREKALTRALIGYSDVYGNYTDVIDEMAHALQTFKKEPTELRREQLRELIETRIHERAREEDVEAKAFLRFHSEENTGHEEVFQRPFQEVHKRPRLIGLNGSKLREMYCDDIVRELKGYVKPVSENQISYREALRKIAVMIYKKDGGLMTKRCLSEYLRTQEFGTGPQKELFLEKYKSPK